MYTDCLCVYYFQRLQNLEGIFFIPLCGPWPYIISIVHWSKNIEFFQSAGKYLPVTQAYVQLACTHLLLIKNIVPSKFSVFALKKKEGPKGDSQFYRNKAHQLVDFRLGSFWESDRQGHKVTN